MYVTLGDAQIQRTRPPWRLHFVLWGPVFVGAQYVSFFKSPFWRLEISGSTWIFGRVLRPCVTPSVYDTMYNDLVSKVNISMSDPRSKHSASRIVATVFGQWTTCGIWRTELLRVCQVTKPLCLLRQSVLRFTARSSFSLVLSAAMRANGVTRKEWVTVRGHTLANRDLWQEGEYRKSSWVCEMLWSMKCRWQKDNYWAWQNKTVGSKKKCERDNVSLRAVIQRNWSKSMDQTLRICRETVTTELRMEMYV
jgi:hypothetical protein